MRLTKIATGALAVAATSGILLFGGASAASAAAAAPAAPAIAPVAAVGAQAGASGKGVTFTAPLTAAQRAQVRQAGATPGYTVPTSNFQAGYDRDHWWFKISKAEVVSTGVGVVCRIAFGASGWFVCPPITAAVNWAISQWPNAGGYWGELYTNGTVRVGTW